jgi:microbial collagenase
MFWYIVCNTSGIQYNHKENTMNKLIMPLLALGISSVITACSFTDEAVTDNSTKSVFVPHANPLAAQVIATDIDTLWSQGFDHYQQGLLKAVADEISIEALTGDLTNDKLEKLTFYLRIYSSFGRDKDWTEETAISVNTALVNLHNMPDFFEVNPTTARLHENYAVALYRLYFLDALQPFIMDQVKPLSQLIRLYASADLSNTTALISDKGTAVDYALWEVLRAGAILPYEARRKNTTEFMKGVHGAGELQQALIKFITAKNNTLKGDYWPKQHALWALAQYYNLYEKEFRDEYYERSVEDQKRLDDHNLTLKVQGDMDELDNSVWAALYNNKAVSIEQNKILFSVPYVVNTFRGKSECDEGTLVERCISPTLEQALPINHACSSRIYILAQAMSAEQLSDSCQQLIAQESNFHEILATNNQPVANDFNDKLRVVIFDNHAEYNKYGQLIFDINTDNGGMYIEGTTQDPNNIATFYSFEHFWLRPEFAVWNLNHEFVHYLDGRFVKYDTFNHFPSHMVWWSEGLAEYIAKEDNNPRTFKLVNEIASQDWPSLMDIFNTEYKDGTDRVYRWGYLAVRFMIENHQDDYRKMAHYLKTDFFEGYKKLVNDSGKKYATEFTQWLVEHNANYIAEDQGNNPHKPRQFYRYVVA